MSQTLGLFYHFGIIDAMTNGLPELTFILVLTVILGFVLRWLKQPLLASYLITGLIFGLLGFLDASNRETFRLMADLGVMFLLFTVGLEMNYQALKSVGMVALIAGISQIAFITLGGFLTAKVLHFSSLSALYLGFALALSSTIVVIKLLTEKNTLKSLTGQITTGILLIQDVIAIVLIIFLTTLEAPNSLFYQQLLFTLAKGFFLFFLVFRLGNEILTPIFKVLNHSSELLFLTSLAWVLSLTTLVNWMGFPLEIGGFLAGISLSNRVENLQIIGRIRPLRDFFLVVFFVFLGSSVLLNNLSPLVLPTIIFSLLVVILTPLFLTFILWRLGYRAKTGFLVGLNLAQVSEFSLILAMLGVKLGHVENQTAAIITLTGIITIIFSGYLINYQEKIAHWFFPKTHPLQPNEEQFKLPLVLIGFHRMGQQIAQQLDRQCLLIVDFDPNMIVLLKKDHYNYLFGDITDEEIREKAGLKQAKIVISTSANLQDNLILLKELKLLTQSPKIILRAESENDRKQLLENGADYVIFPHETIGRFLGQAIATGQF